MKKLLLSLLLSIATITCFSDVLTKTEMYEQIAEKLPINTTGRITAAGLQSLTTDIFDSSFSETEIVVNELADLGSLVSGFYQLSAGKYIFNRNIDLGSNGIELIDLDGFYTFTSPTFQTISSTTSVELIKSGNTGQVLVARNFFINAPNGTAIKMTNGNSLIVSTVVITADIPVHVDTMEFFTVFDALPLVGCGSGCIINDVNVISMQRPQWSSSLDVGGSAFSITGLGSRCVITSLDCEAEATESILNIDSLYEGVVSITGGVFTDQGGVFFKAGSKNQTTIGVDVLNIGGVANSKTIGSVTIQNNTTTTTLVQNVWTDFNFNNLAELTDSNERFELVSATTGEIRYVGLEDFEGGLVGTLSGLGVGSTAEYHVRAVIDDAPITPTSILSANQISSTMSNTSFITDISLSTNQRVRLQINNITNSSSFTAKFVTYRVQ